MLFFEILEILVAIGLLYAIPIHFSDRITTVRVVIVSLAAGIEFYLLRPGWGPSREARETAIFWLVTVATVATVLLTGLLVSLHRKKAPNP